MFCKDKGIHIIAFYPNSTHIQQPLDVAIFRPLKKEWAKEVHDRRMKSQDSLSKDEFAPLLNQDSSAIDYSKCITKEVENEVELEPITTVERNKDNIRGHKYLESLIEPNVIAEFRENINEEWNGLKQSKHLFDIWRKSTPSTSTAGCFQKSTPATASEEKRREILAKKISPATGGEGVLSPFKKNLLWPKSPQKKKNKSENEKKKNSSPINKCEQKYNSKKTVIDSEEDWTCTVYLCRYNLEFHVNYIPKKHQKEFDLNYVDDEVEFICHLCITDDKDCMSEMELESEEQESDDN
ncbi:hypothetical protein QTP88_019962 [Uroleucon formosanum]